MGYYWARVMEDAEALSDDEKAEYLGLKFLICGYRGVGEFLEFIHKNRTLLQEAV